MKLLFLASLAAPAILLNFSCAPNQIPAAHAQTLLAQAPTAPRVVPADNVIFPADARIINVKEAPYGAKGDGTTDDTAALQAALDGNPARGAIIFLPNGTYLVSGDLHWPKSSSGGGYMKDTIMQGQSEAGAIIRLKDNTPAFGNAEKTEVSDLDGQAARPTLSQLAPHAHH